MVKNFGQECGQSKIINQPPCHPYALVKAHQMRAGIDMRSQPRRLNRAAQKGAGGAFAIGARHMENGREMMMRVAKPFEQGGDTSKAQNILARGQHRQPIKLRLNGRVSGGSVVRHALVLCHSRARGNPWSALSVQIEP